MTKHIQNASRVGILLDGEDKANAALIAKVYRTSNSGAVRIALAEVAERLRLHSDYVRPYVEE
ncbi:MAG: hypothetical protein ABFD92_21070 [Planctomycetaceae bacterium]